MKELFEKLAREASDEELVCLIQTISEEVYDRMKGVDVWGS